MWHPWEDNVNNVENQNISSESESVMSVENDNAVIEDIEDSADQVTPQKQHLSACCKKLVLNVYNGKNLI